MHVCYTDIEVQLDSEGKPLHLGGYQSDPTKGDNLTNVAIPYYDLDQEVLDTQENSNSEGKQR